MAGGLAARFSKLPVPQSSDVKATAMWGVSAGTGALCFVQPFDWIKKTFFEKLKANNFHDVAGSVGTQFSSSFSSFNEPILISHLFQ